MHLTKLVKLKYYLIKEIFPIFPGTRIELGKETMISLNPPEKSCITEFYEKVKEKALNVSPSFNVTHSKSAVDINPPHLNKLEGIRIISLALGIKLDEICSIGDSFNDIEVLKGVGFSAAPANAHSLVKKNVCYVSQFEDGEGVIDIINQCVKQNLYLLKRK